jgi:hypothetical protein
MPTSFSGGCACGAIRYECSTDSPLMGNCHCRDCQRASGGAFTAVVVVPAASLKLLQGEPKYHVVKADSGNWASRGFCPDCGSPLFAKSEATSGFIAIKAGSLDDPSWFKPMVDIWTASAQAWDYMNPELAKFPKAPQM